MITYSYSTDEEHYNGDFSTREEAAQVGLAENEEIDLIFVGENVPPNPQDKIDAEEMFQHIRDCHEENFSLECADNWRPEDSPHLNELESMLGAALLEWMKKYDQVPRFFTVENITQHERP